MRLIFIPDHIIMMICAGIPIKKSGHIFVPNAMKKRKTVASSDHIRQEIIKKLRRLLNQIELKTNHTIIDTGTDQTNTSQQPFLPSPAKFTFINIKVATNHTSSMLIPVMSA